MRKSLLLGKLVVIVTVLLLALLLPPAANAVDQVYAVQPGEALRAGSAGKWIEVDLSSQTTRARIGNKVVRSMRVSTGISRYPTPTGRFRIYAKYPAVTMSGPGYYLPRVPHTMFFYRGYALHGTYWHSNFGHRMSHGCINLKRADAAWLYRWAPKGTLVVIHR